MPYASRRLPVRLPLLGLALLALVGCSTPQAAIEQPTIAPAPPLDDSVVHVQQTSASFIGVESVGATRSPSLVNAPAHVDFRDGAVSQLGSLCDGRVLSVYAAVGDRVKAGDPLVALDCPDAAEIRAQVESARAALREAKAAVERQERMLKEGVGIERDKIAAETHMQAAQAEVDRVEADAAFVGVGTGTRVVLRAPLAGSVITRKASVGLAVQKGAEPIIEIGDPSGVWVVADVFERDLALVHEQARVTIELPSQHDPLEGHVVSVGTVLASGLRTAPVRIAIDTKGADLRPGTYGRVQLQAFDGDITVPTQAILIKDGKESVVYVQRDPLTFERRVVRVAQHSSDGDRIQVISGLAPGEKVVVRGALLLDGSAEQLL